MEENKELCNVNTLNTSNGGGCNAKVPICVNRDLYRCDYPVTATLGTCMGNTCRNRCSFDFDPTWEYHLEIKCVNEEFNFPQCDRVTVEIEYCVIAIDPATGECKYENHQTHTQECREADFDPMGTGTNSQGDTIRPPDLGGDVSLEDVLSVADGSCIEIKNIMIEPSGDPIGSQLDVSFDVVEKITKLDNIVVCADFATSTDDILEKQIGHVDVQSIPNCNEGV